MKTENQLKQLLSTLGFLPANQFPIMFNDLSGEEIITLVKLHNATGIIGGKSDSIRLKMYNELFKRKSIGKAQGRHLSSKQKSFLESLGLIPEKKKPEMEGLDRVDRLILQYLERGYTQLEVSELLQKMEIKPNSLSIIEKRLKSIREKFGAKTNFHLAVILFKK